MPPISGFAITSMPSALSAIRGCDAWEGENIDLVGRRRGETLKRRAVEPRQYCGRNWQVPGGCACLPCVALPHQRHGVFLREIPC